MWASHMRGRDGLGSLMSEGEDCWVSTTSILGEAIDYLDIGFGKTLLLELVCGVRKAHEGLLDPNWLNKDQVSIYSIDLLLLHFYSSFSCLNYNIFWLFLYSLLAFQSSQQISNQFSFPYHFHNSFASFCLACLQDINI